MTEALLLEIGLEELPARYVRASVEQLGVLLENLLKEEAISYQSVETFATPRRLAVRVNGVSEKQKDRIEIFKGPALSIAKKDGQWTKAAEGFARGKGVLVSDLYVEQVQGIDYVYARKEMQGALTVDVLNRSLAQVIKAMKFPVTMRWNTHTFEYLRPFHWIVAMFGSSVLDQVKVLFIQANRISKGHRFLGGDVSIDQPATYEKQLREEFVIVDQDRRKAEIVQQIEKLATNHQWNIPIDEELLEEVSAILEYPTVFYGVFDEKYLVVPTPVLVTTMKEHQRYFVAYDQLGNLLPIFISARNGNDLKIENVVKGNQKVLTARLEDALFFYQEDQKLTISQCLEKLATLNFHAKIGSMTDKMERVKSIIDQLAKQLPLSQEVISTAKRAAEIYKFDLVTNMVGEFSELQGVMGEIYALEHGETKEVAQAIREHYLPNAADGALPQSQAGALLALADKLDSFLAFMAVGLIPTGSNDPYALRRQVMGIVQIVDAFAWNLDLLEVMQAVISTEYSQLTLNRSEETKQAIATFLRDRLVQKLQSVTEEHDVIEATLNQPSRAVPVLMEIARVLTNKKATKEFKLATEAYNRVVNISLKDQTKQTLLDEQASHIDPSLFQTESERNLFKAVDQLISDCSVEDQFAQLEQLVPYITAFFDENMVMVNDLPVRNNRIALLRRLARYILAVADFSALIL